MKMNQLHTSELQLTVLFMSFVKVRFSRVDIFQYSVLKLRVGYSRLHGSLITRQLSMP